MILYGTGIPYPQRVCDSCFIIGITLKKDEDI